MAVVYNAERLNGLAARHWRKFSKQNYFDSQGIFTSALLSGPLLLIMFAMLVSVRPALWSGQECKMACANTQRGVWAAALPLGAVYSRL